MEKCDAILHPSFQRFERFEPYAIKFQNVPSKSSWAYIPHFLIFLLERRDMNVESWDFLSPPNHSLCQIRALQFWPKQILGWKSTGLDMEVNLNLKFQGWYFCSQSRNTLKWSIYLQVNHRGTFWNWFRHCSKLYPHHWKRPLVLSGVYQYSVAVVRRIRGFGLILDAEYGCCKKISAVYG